MIIINKYGLLKYKNLKFKCALGKAGIGEKKKEGDFITPKGKYKIIKVYYRADRIKKIKTNFRLYQIKKNLGWCDDPLSKNYNKLIKLPSIFSYEKLYRKDKLYDLILVLNYNFKPIIKNKGSAIFIHIANKNYKKTMGCIGLKKKDLIFILKDIKKNITVKII
jgi:L,D-peptidoglycan transpeptidase YkuD (ErfK/YbiS/YcfS/YnhG family)